MKNTEAKEYPISNKDFKDEHRYHPNNQKDFNYTIKMSE